MKISARNKFVGKVKKITHGTVELEVVIALPGGQEMVSVITETSVKFQAENRVARHRFHQGVQRHTGRALRSQRLRLQKDRTKPAQGTKKDLRIFCNLSEEKARRR